MLLTKVYNISAWKVQRSYVWWHSRLIQSLKKNWLVLPRTTWGIWQIFIRAFESLTNGTLMASIFLSWKCMSLIKFKRKVCVMAMKNDPKIEEEFDGFWPEHLKISKICTLMGCFWPKYIMFEFRKHKWVMFDGTEYWCKVWRKTDLQFWKWHGEFSKFLPEHFWKSKYWDFGILLSKVENVWA